MTRVLVLGANGMIGHRVWLAANARHETWGTFRTPISDVAGSTLFNPSRVIAQVSVNDPESFERAFSTARPDAVVNALGLIKQRPQGNDPSAAFAANTYVPHHVRRLADAAGARLIQLSTDCVFSGERGGYTEDDATDARDVYGLSKALGEIGEPHLTLRTSAVGRSLSGEYGLLEWLLAQSGPVAGYRRVVFSGLSTQRLAETVVDIIDGPSDLAGLWHVASAPINKHDLLLRLSSAFGLGLTIDPVDEPIIDRSLNDDRFRNATGLPRPDWDEMAAQVAADPVPYATLRSMRRES